MALLSVLVQAGVPGAAPTRDLLNVSILIAWDSCSLAASRRHHLLNRRFPALSTRPLSSHHGSTVTTISRRRSRQHCNQKITHRRPSTNVLRLASFDSPRRPGTSHSPTRHPVLTSFQHSRFSPSSRRFNFELVTLAARTRLGSCVQAARLQFALHPRKGR